MVDLKLAIHKHDFVLDSKIDDFRSQIATLTCNNEALAQENSELAKFTSTSDNKEVTVQNVDELVHPSNVFSKALLELQAKNSAIEDCMAIVKKSYDKDQMDLKAFLKIIRELSKK